MSLGWLQRERFVVVTKVFVISLVDFEKSLLLSAARNEVFNKLLIDEFW